jgi:hypothetical protein
VIPTLDGLGCRRELGSPPPRTGNPPPENEAVRDYLDKLDMVYKLRSHKAARFNELVVK